MRKRDRIRSPAPPGSRRRGGRSYRGPAVALLSGAIFAVLFYLWGEELLPRAAGRLDPTFPFVGAVALTLAVGLFLFEWFGFAGREVRKVRLAARDFVFLFSLSLLLFFIAKGVLEVLPRVQVMGASMPVRTCLYLIPITAFAMVVRILLNSEVAILFTVAASVLSAAAARGSWSALLFLLLCGTAGASRSGRIPDRHRLLRAGVLAAPICAIGAVTLEFAFHGRGGLGWALILGGINGLLAGPAALALLPVAESVFGYASDIRLMELSGTGHPLLRRLMAEAPGTFHHSILVGTLAEAGAAAIGANPVLCRVAALYHDVGKVEKPAYFSENQAGGSNVHDALSPGMSRLVVQAHVRDGVRLAREHRLPDRIVEIIEQHHGTALLYGFIDKAKALIGEKRAEEETFRYPGPRPRTREAAIIMLADTAEAAVRSLKAPSPAEVRDVVRRIVDRAYLDGQLDECDMSLKDLHAVSRSMVTVLSAVSHGRVEYPEDGRGPVVTLRP